MDFILIYDENPGLRIESFAIVKRVVFLKQLSKQNVETMQFSWNSKAKAKSNMMQRLLSVN
jgi:hypothetical protein